MLYGPSGSGKTTLLSLIKEEIAPRGVQTGQIERGFKSHDAAFMFQNPQMQIVTDKVFSELAFACENQGFPREKIRQRVAETAQYFGLGDIFRSETHCLSGGQMQLLNLAAVCVTRPKLLILDEPASMLDPLSAQRFTDIIIKMNRDFGTTVVISEHNCENIFAYAHRVLYMENGKIVSLNTPEETARILKNSPMADSLPCGARLAAALGKNVPLTNAGARAFLTQNGYGGKAMQEASDDGNDKKEVALRIKDVSFRYERDGREILRKVSLTAFKGEILAVAGANGSGKSTLLSVVSGLSRPTEGSVKYMGKPLKKYKSELYRGNIALLPQNPNDCFVKDNLKDDWRQMASLTEYGDFSDLAREMGLEAVMDSHPYDLSGGEQQRAALGKVLMQRPKLLLLDEPCKGLDAPNKRKFKEIIRRLAKEGTSVLMVTHDLELAAELADRCAFLFDSEIVSCTSPRELFCENAYYTTSAAKVARGIFEGCVSVEDLIALCKGEAK